jgi:hypothetical protein
LESNHSRVVQVGASESICSSIGGTGEKRKEGMKLRLPPKLVEKLVWVVVLTSCKISFPYYAETGCSPSMPTSMSILKHLVALCSFFCSYNILSWGEKKEE